MSEIRTKPATKRYRENFDRIFKKQHPQRLCSRQASTSAPLGVTCDENIDWGEFKTQVCVNNDPHFGG
jgi:hypothetical protein